MIASDDSGQISAEAGALLPLLPLPYVTSADAGWTRGLLSPSAVRLAPRTGFALSLNDGRAVIRGGYGVFLNQWAYSVQTAFARNLPFFYTRQVDVPLTATVPVYQTSSILTANPTGTVSPSIMDHDYAVEYTQTWSGGLQYELAGATHGRSHVHGFVDARRRQRDHPQRPRARPRRHPGAAADSGARSDPRHPIRRQVDLSRRDAQTGAAAA